MSEVAAGMVVTVSSWVGEKTWEGQPEQVVQVKLDGTSTYYALLSRLEPLKKGAGVPTTTEAAGLLFTKVPESRRNWCEQFARRLLVSSDESTILIYSGSADDECAGYLALVTDTGTAKGARVLAQARRGPVQSVVLHQLPQGPALIQLDESLPANARVTGIRRTFLGLAKPALKELLSVDIRRDELAPEHKNSVLAEVEVTPSEQGLDIEVRRTELQVILATGAERSYVRQTRNYRYANGKLSPQQPSRRSELAP
ncbi:hypothetical protein [Archangium sp.]|uniref:hypothetical protein n=1 Tax=Archangium sp. TaxID=1872627 RepID=UPI002ED7B611